MPILSRVKINPQQRYDLEDFFAQQSSARTDSKLWTQKFLSESNLIMGGFTVSGIGLNAATVAMANSSLIIPENSTDFSYFVSAPSEPNVVIPDADLTDGARNYVEVSLITQNGTPLTKAFWDPEANSGAGSEFNQIVDTITDLAVVFSVSTSGFSGDPDSLPICIIDTDGSGTIKAIFDRRELFGRLSKPNDLDNEYAWGSKIEPAYQLNMTSVTGVFLAGEEITVGGETATVVTGGTTSIAFNEPTGINFGNGDSVLGSTSGATGTVDTIGESFVGVDKNLTGQKEINDALMTEIKKVKKTRFWWQDSPTLIGLKDELMSTVAGLSAGARVKWDGTKLVLTDDSLTPALTDNVAAIRVLSSTATLNLRRQDDGKEVVTITVSEIPDEGTYTINQNGNLIAIDWNDSTSDIQTAWNASGAFAATISGSLAAKKIVVTASAAGAQVDVIQSANTLKKSTVTVTPTIVVKQGMAADGSITIADGQVLYVDLLEPISSQNYSGVGSGAANYKLATRGSAALSDKTYWLAYREGSKLIWRFSGELQAGESSEISDNVPQGLLDAIGIATETSMPSYSSDVRGSTQESLVKRTGALTDAVSDAQEDRSAYLRSDTAVTWNGSALSFSDNLILEILNTKSGTLTRHTISSSNSPLNLVDQESAWIQIDRTLASETVTLKQTSVDAIPSQRQATKDVFVLFRRNDAGSGYLHIPLHKQILSPGDSVLLGATASSASSTGYTEFLLANGQASPTDVTGFLLDSSANNAFDALISIIRLHTDPTGSVSSSFAGGFGDLNGTVLGTAVTSADAVVAVGSFTTLAGATTRNRIAKFSSAGVDNSTFYANIGTGGINGQVNAIAQSSGGDLYLGGVFTTVGVTASVGVAKLSSSGVPDATYASNIGTGGATLTIALQPDDKLLVGGTGPFNGSTAQSIVRLNADGTLDSAFNTNLGTGITAGIHAVNSICVQADGKIVVAGKFSAFNGSTVPSHCIRLNSDGTMDTTFNTNLGTGFSDIVNAVSQQSDGKLLIGGAFTTLNGTGSVRIVRLNTNGTIDGTFSVGAGFTGGSVTAIDVQSDDRLLVGGAFTSYQGNGIANLVRVQTSGAQDTVFDANVTPSPDSSVAAISHRVGGVTAVGGAFSNFGGLALGRLGLLLSSSVERRQVQTIFGAYSFKDSQWDISAGIGAFVDAGITFTITAVGQLQYVSTTLSGPIVKSVMRFLIRRA